VFCLAFIGNACEVHSRSHTITSLDSFRTYHLQCHEAFSSLIEAITLNGHIFYAFILVLDTLPTSIILLVDSKKIEFVKIQIAWFVKL